MTNAVIFDLDGTLCNIDHRLHHVQDGNKDWDKFFEGIPNDKLNYEIAELLFQLYEAKNEILLCSGRPEKYRDMTMRWLDSHKIRFTDLYMRPDNDTRPDHVIKKQLLDGIKEDGYEPWLVIDDRQTVVDMWREEGLTCLQAAPDKKAIPETARLDLMVGPSGAGKTTWLEEIGGEYEIWPHHIVSSDAIRMDYGCWDDMSKNPQVFAAAHAIASARLKHGLPVVIDATHLRRRDRLAAVALAKGQCPVRYFVINRSMEEKRRDGGWRNELEFDLIAKHEQTFKSQLKEILKGDDLPNVEVIDLRDDTSS